MTAEKDQFPLLPNRGRSASASARPRSSQRFLCRQHNEDNVSSCLSHQTDPSARARAQIKPQTQADPAESRGGGRYSTASRTMLLRSISQDTAGEARLHPQTDQGIAENF